MSGEHIPTVHEVFPVHEERGVCAFCGSEANTTTYVYGQCPSGFAPGVRGLTVWQVVLCPDCALAKTWGELLALVAALAELEIAKGGGHV